MNKTQLSAQVQPGSCAGFRSHQRGIMHNGFAQVDTRQDASYYGTWCSPAERTIVSFSEGDVTTTVCETDEELVAELREFARWTDEAGYGPMKIDAVCHDGLRPAFEKLGLADLLH